MIVQKKITMRTSIILFVVMLLTGGVKAQSQYCGTSKQDLKKLQQQVYQIKQQEGPHQKRALKDTTYYIPLKAHIVGKDDGTGYYSFNRLLKAMCNLNKQMEQTNMYFYLKGGVDYIDNSDYYQHNFQQGNTMMAQNNVSNAVNVYFVDDPNGACGYFSDLSNAVAINNACAGPNNATIAHELGHFFGLPHTFSGWEGTNISNGETISPSNQELVDGSNCNSVADGFCDTPPDYLSYRWPCPQDVDFTDPNGDTINPDESLIMSYALDNCQQSFSASQKDYMINNSLLSQRKNLLNNNVPNIDSIGKIDTLTTNQGQNNVAANNAILKWEAAENATHYYVETRGSDDIQAFTTDTFYIANNLKPEKKYYWSVKPYSNGNTCTQGSKVSNFTTADTCLTTKVDSANSIYYVSVNGGTPPYSFDWSNGDVDSLLVTQNPGTYTVTVSDADDCVATEKITIQEKTNIGSAQTASNENNVSLYPNPIVAGDQVNLSFSNKLNGKGEVSFYTVEGKRVRTIGLNFQDKSKLSIETDQLSEGMYIVRIQSASHSTSKKVILH